jgi:hypothetical protein
MVWQGMGSFGEFLDKSFEEIIEKQKINVYLKMLYISSLAKVKLSKRKGVVPAPKRCGTAP